MNDKFYELPQEKQLRIINAGLEVFSQNEYKRASTDEIARISGTSKGLLFYYFHNKKEFYLFLYEYAVELVTKRVVSAEYNEITDFFVLCEYAAKGKMELLEKMPYISDFVVRAFYSQKEDISEEMNKNMKDATSGIFSAYCSQIDLSKFKESINPLEILQMLTWLTDGYLHEQQRVRATEVSFDRKALMDKFHQWVVMLKQISYKEEFLNESGNSNK